MTDNIIVSFAKNNYMSNIIKLLTLKNPNKVLPLDLSLIHI